MADDAVALASGELSVPALYRATGTNTSVPIQVVISSSNEAAYRGSGPVAAAEKQTKRQVTSIFVAAAPGGVDAGGGMTAKGAVIQLRKNDVITVSGSQVGRADSEVQLRVTGDPILSQNSSWTAEVMV